GGTIDGSAIGVPDSRDDGVGIGTGVPSAPGVATDDRFPITTAARTRTETAAKPVRRPTLRRTASARTRRARPRSVVICPTPERRLVAQHSAPVPGRVG